MDRLHDKNDTGKMLGVKPCTVVDWSAKGLIKSVILGGRRLFPELGIARVIEDAKAGRGPLSRGHSRGRAAVEARRAKAARGAVAAGSCATTPPRPRIAAHAYSPSPECQYATPEARAAREHGASMMVLDLPVRVLALSTRAQNCLAYAGVSTVREIVSKTEYDWLCTRNLGRVTLREVADLLFDLGLHFGMGVSR